ncbi:CaiB/BaiF CoA transferase family protein [Nocardia alni]|uniref:CaiB/BaiF CoA transferase family protein n=1 Tax=Nocardia alni TaxID=2815723 RepID=UPI0027DEE6F5|nr:CaiB/BaiF CoA-transferase family protein [Nocardia alni]
MRVVDVSRVLAGPYAAQLLGDHGADVIKVEPPAGDGTRAWGQTYPENISAYYAGLNRNKRHTSVDLATSGGREVLLRMLEHADVLIENFKPGTMERWGLDAEDLLSRFPRLIYCRISAFGAEGPMGGLPGYDAVMQAYAGIMHLNGEQGRGPLRVPMPITDLTTGLHAFSGILLALYERAASDLGQVVEVSLLDSAVSLLHPAAAAYFLDGQRPRRLGAAHPSISPSDIFRTADGHEVYVAAGTDHQFRLLCEFLDAPELAQDARFRTNHDRLEHNAELTDLLAKLIADLAADDAMVRRMIAEGIPASVVRPLDEVLDDAQVRLNGMVQTVGEFQVLGIPAKLGRTPGSLRTPPARQGRDTREVLLEMGLTDAQIDDLIAQGIVKPPAP